MPKNDPISSNEKCYEWRMPLTNDEKYINNSLAFPELGI